MVFELKTIDKSKLYTSIVDQLSEGIRSAAFPSGTALPSERELARQLGVSRGSVREAVRVLEHAGVLEVRTGSGTYVTAEGVSKAALLRAHAELAGQQSPLDVMVARRALEPVCAEEAAKHRLSQDVQRLWEGIREQADLVERGEDPAEVDLRFHVNVAAAGHNPVLVALTEPLVDFMRQSLWRALKHQSSERPGRVRLYLEQHERIAQRVEEGDPLGAAQAMHEHLGSVGAGLLDEVGRE